MFDNIHGIPISVIAKWPLPNYVNPVRRTWFLPYGYAFEIVGSLILGLRLYNRFTRKQGSPGIDDVFIAVAWVFALILTILLSLGTFKNIFS